MTYEELGIDPDKLKRDYLKNPYRKHSKDTIPKEDLVYLYNELYLPRSSIVKLIGLSEVQLVRKLKKFGIRRIVKTTDKNTLLEIIKIHNIQIEKLSRNYIENPLVRYANRKFEKPIKEDLVYLYRGLNIDLKTLAKFFGVKKSCFANWVLEYDIQKPKSESVKIGIKTNLKKYGVRIQFKRAIIQEKIKATTLRKYGTTHISQSKYYKERMQKQRADINEKIFATKRKRGTIGNKSKQEDTIYSKLTTKFSDTLRQYKSDKYPFLCDFYIPSLDLYIEYQGCWTHGFKPFLNSKEDKKKLKVLKERAKKSKYYEQAIKVWTISDPLKRETARKNGLNWIEFFTLDEFERWFASI